MKLRISTARELAVRTHGAPGPVGTGYRGQRCRERKLDLPLVPVVYLDGAPVAGAGGRAERRFIIRLQTGRTEARSTWW